MCGNIYYQERAFEIFELCTTIQNKSRQPLHSMPSNWGRGKSASWRRVEIIKAFAFIRVKDSLPKIWPVTSPSSSPLHLARALASNLTWVHPGEGRPRSPQRMGGRPGLHVDNLLQSLSVSSSPPSQEHHLLVQQLQQLSKPPWPLQLPWPRHPLLPKLVPF